MAQVLPMRFVPWIALVMLVAGCSNPINRFLRQYEYEEEMYLSLDGSATLYVNTSMAALNALRGTAFDEDPERRIDRTAVRAYFSSPVTAVTRVTESRRNNRRYAHVRIDVPDVRRLSEAPAFAWSAYEFDSRSKGVVFRQSWGPPAANASPDKSGTWDGSELVAVRVHIPSRVTDHNAGADNLRRGNILVWEQSLAERLRGVPIVAEAWMEPESILSRTLVIFGATAFAVVLTFAGVLWWLVRKPRRPAPRA